MSCFDADFQWVLADKLGTVCMWIAYRGSLNGGSPVRVRSAGQKYGPTCHQRDRADVTEFVTLVRLSSLGQHVGVLALAGYKRRKSALTANPIVRPSFTNSAAVVFETRRACQKPEVAI